MNISNLKGKTAVITGAGGVLCGAFAHELAKYGVKIAVVDLNLEAAQKIAAQINEAGGNAKEFSCNVLDKESVIKCEQEISTYFGTYHILINGAGGNNPKANTTNEYYDEADVENPDIISFFDLSIDGFSSVFSLNFMGSFIPTQVFARKLINVKGASIINMSSMSSPFPMTKVPAYSAAKAAIDNFTKWTAVHFAKTGLRVNAIAPGFFLTNQNHDLLIKPDGSLTARSEKIISHTPMGRFGEVEDLLGTLLWLCDDSMSGFITGVTIPVDGGFLAYSGV
ncbi:MAG: SDR family oxidoreductase [Lachnospiraceae bacterium]|nr:SDR family oxidoreductase [Lachnospiraceae bacterium]